jgi:alkylation response protein AidB-like acyl-CoA dehydrogenase
MDFAFSADQQALRAVARDFLANEFPIGRVAELAESEAGWDPGSWKQIHDLGWLSLSVPEDDGGAGMGFLEEAVVFEETGRALYPGPVFSTLALARPALADSELLAPVLSGQATATLAWAEDGALGLLDSPRVHADSAGRLTGTKRYVPDLALADFAVVVADTGLHAVDLRENPGAVLPRPTLDRTRRLGDLVLDETPATHLPAGREVLDEVRLRSMAALACEAVGVGSSALDLASGYARTREQFGRPIGSYQGVSHRIANIYLAVELARSLAYWAACAVSAGDASAPLAVAAAKSEAAEAAVFACENAIQTLGGIGFTYDHPLHRFYKRAQGIDVFEGTGAAQRAEIAAALLD